MEALGLMQDEMKPPHHDEELKPAVMVVRAVHASPEPEPSFRGGGGAYEREFNGYGNAPEKFQPDEESAVKPTSWGTGEVQTPERPSGLYGMPSGPRSPGGDSMVSNQSYSSEMEAEEAQARARVEHVRRSFDSRPMLTDGGRESGGGLGESGGFAPPNLAELQAANRNRALTPAGPVPRPSEAQRLQMHSRGGARRAAPGSMAAGAAENFFSDDGGSIGGGGGGGGDWGAAFGNDPHVPPPMPNQDTGRPWGGYSGGGGGGNSGSVQPQSEERSPFRVEYEVERSPTHEQQQFAQQQQQLQVQQNQQMAMQMQG